MSRDITYLQAIGEALAQEMSRDAAVIAFGEDNIGGSGSGGILGCAWGPTMGLYQQFPEQLLDTPISEAAFTGAAIGASMTGLRPVIDLLFTDFAGVCFDQILNQAAKLRYMTGGSVRIPLVMRMMWGAGLHGAAQHSQTLHPLFTHIPGLKVAVPATPHDAKGLMITAIRDDDPVVFFEHKMLYYTSGPVPTEPYAVPFGSARLVREGSDCTIVAIGRLLHTAERAAQELADSGVECEIIDPRTLSPLDTDTIYASVERTGRLVVADESNPRCSIASDICALVAQHAFGALRAPVRMVTAPHAPVPFSPALEDLYVPDAARIVAAVREITGAPGPGRASARRERATVSAESEPR
jgi:acetoin:2,6-dichlorophenolindophenol oxidoreductase subunit beta